MRVDDYLSTVGVIKRRTVAKELGQSGLLEINGQKVKPAHPVRPGDIIRIKGTRALTVEVLAIPSGSIPREQRDRYFKTITPE